MRLGWIGLQLYGSVYLAYKVPCIWSLVFQKRMCICWVYECVKVCICMCVCICVFEHVRVCTYMSLCVSVCECVYVWSVMPFSLPVSYIYLIIKSSIIWYIPLFGSQSCFLIYIISYLLTFNGKLFANLFIIW